MTREDRKVFATELAILAEVRRVDLTTTMLESYFEDLAEFQVDEVRAAIRLLRRTRTFWPQPVEIIEAITEARRTERRALAETRRALPGGEPMTTEEAQGFLAELRQRIGAFIAGPSPASRRTLAEIEAEAERLKAEPPDPEHEQRKREMLDRFRETA